MQEWNQTLYTLILEKLIKVCSRNVASDHLIIGPGNVVYLMFSTGSIV